MTLINYHLFYEGYMKGGKMKRFLLYTPLSIYFAWSLVATIASTTGFLWMLGFGGYNAVGEIWTVIMLVLLTGFTVLMITRDRDLPFALTIIWSVIGIYMKFPQVTSLVYTIAVALITIGFFTIKESIEVIRNRNQN